ncbi:MAG TPA: hypothetical protein VEJ00_09340, partial [Candidatus Acidoferrales bacterium]|nr:hypothetical protein [Candidatus Acidoferrales bacterium]
MIRTRRSCTVLFTLMSSLALGRGRLAHAQTASLPPKLSVHWEELTAADFREGIRRSQGTCLLP